MNFCANCQFAGLNPDGSLPVSMLCFHPAARTTTGFNLVTGQKLDIRRSAWDMRMNSDFTVGDPTKAVDCGREGRLFVQTPTPGRATAISQVPDVFAPVVQPDQL